MADQGTQVAGDEVTRCADEAAAAWVQNPSMAKPVNPYPAGTAAAARWKAHFERCLLERSAAEGCEGSA